MVLNSPPSGENTTLTVLKWQEKEVSDTSVPGTEFEFTLASSRVISQLTGIKATESTPTKFSEDATNGRRDCDVYFRKNGVDYSVDGASTAITSVKEGTTKIEVTFAQSVTTDEADAIVLSYAYIDATNPVPSKYCIKDYNPKQSGRDYTTINCLGGVTKKRRQPQDLTELSLTLFKTGTGLTSYMLGKRAVLTENSLTVTSTSGGNYVENVAIGVVVTDPDNSKNKIGWIMTNAGATANDHKGGADADLEETISFKSDPEDYAEFEYTTS